MNDAFRGRHLKTCLECTEVKDRFLDFGRGSRVCNDCGYDKATNKKYGFRYTEMLAEQRGCKVCHYIPSINSPRLMADYHEETGITGGLLCREHFYQVRDPIDEIEDERVRAYVMERDLRIKSHVRFDQRPK
jgi:hypothetical protein